LTVPASKAVSLHLLPALDQSNRQSFRSWANLAEYKRELILSEGINAGIAAARRNGTRFGRPIPDPADKLAIASDASSGEDVPSLATVSPE
jgi:DNA invertase Pin-like site-specific DNA recombinase